MWRLCLFVICWITCVKGQNDTSCGVPIFNPPDRHVIGGGDAPLRGLYPWMLAIETLQDSEWEHHCGAVLFDPEWALTAARCVDGTGSHRVVAGLYNRSDTSEEDERVQIEFTSDDVTIHEDWDSELEINDIALIHLDPPAEGEYIRTICLPPSSDTVYYDNPNCLMAGWGLTESENPDSGADTLQDALMTVLRNEDCEIWYMGAGSLVDDQICAHDDVNDSMGSCDGDEGGPLMCVVNGRFDLAGISSFTDDFFATCDTLMPTVYTRVTSYLSWIEENTNGASSRRH